MSSQGRFLVGLPDGAKSGLSFGGPSLTSTESRLHRHSGSGQIRTSSHGIALASGFASVRRFNAAFAQQYRMSPSRLRGAAGDLLPAGQRTAALTLLLRWAIGQQRPDQAALGDPIPREAWIDRTSWRPVLALTCQFGFAPVPAFRDRYRGHADEAAASHLCGLWSVGASTYYRYLDKGKRALATLLRESPVPPAQRLALRALALQQARLQAGPEDDGARQTWHARRAAEALLRQSNERFFAVEARVVSRRVFPAVKI